jgi:CubicO group peptidase (beta-lactamase class C family)
MVSAAQEIQRTPGKTYLSSLKTNSHETTSFISIFSFTIFCSGQSSSIKKSPVLPQQAAIFDKYIQDAMPLWKVPGLSVAVVKDGKVFLKRIWAH